MPGRTGCGATPRAVRWSVRPWRQPSPLDLLPLVDPLVVGRAVVPAAVHALLLGRCPVVDLGGVRLIGRVVDVAEVLLGGELARLRLGRRLTEVLGHLGVDLR